MIWLINVLAAENLIVKYTCSHLLVEELQVIATVVILTKHCVNLLHQFTLVREYSEYRLFITYTNTLSAVLVYLSYIALHHPLTLKKNKQKQPTKSDRRTHIHRNHDCIFSGEQALSFSSALGCTRHSMTGTSGPQRPVL